MKEKNALERRRDADFVCSDTTAGSIQSPDKKTRDYAARSDDSISPELESRLVPNDSPSRREERQLEARFWISFSGERL